MGKYIIASTNFWVGLLAAMFIVQIVDRFDLIDKAKPLFGNEVTESIEDLSTDEMVDASDDPIVVELGFGKGRKNAVRAEMDAYVKRFAPTAVREQAKFGIPASISLAQGILESASGTSDVCKNSKNHFGIKCFNKKHKKWGKGHKGKCWNAHDDHATDHFVIFKTDWDSWRRHSTFLSEYDRYKFLFKSSDYRVWAHGLQKAGYATSKTYAKKLIKLIETLNLQRFDAAN